MQVHDPSGVIHEATFDDVENTELSVELSDAEPGTYLIHIFSADGVNSPTKDYNLRITTAPSSTTRVFYANDEETLGDFYAECAGNDANDGLTPQTPKRSVQSLLAQYDLAPDDLVLIDTGTYDQGSNSR